MQTITPDLTDLPLRPRGAEPITVGPLMIDHWSRVVLINGEEIQLTRREYDILRTLASHPTRVFSKDELYEHIWGAPGLRSRTLDTQVARLRAKLAMRGTPDLVQTVRGHGYRLTAPELTVAAR